MKKIKIFLEKNKIEYTISKNGEIIINLEKGCIWVNGYGEKMQYNKYVKIFQNTYKEYYCVEVTGYNCTKTLKHSGKQLDIITTLEKRLNF